MQNLTPSRKKSVWCMVISLIVIYCIWMDPYQVRWTLFILCLKDYFGVNYTNCVWMCITLWLCSVSDIFPGIKEDLEWKGSMYISVWIHVFVWFLYISVFVMYHFIRNTNLYYHANSFASNFPKYSCIQNLGTLTLRLLLIFCFKRFFFLIVKILLFWIIPKLILCGFYCQYMYLICSIWLISAIIMSMYL